MDLKFDNDYDKINNKSGDQKAADNAVPGVEKFDEKLQVNCHAIFSADFFETETGFRTDTVLENNAPDWGQAPELQLIRLRANNLDFLRRQYVRVAVRHVVLKKDGSEKKQVLMGMGRIALLCDPSSVQVAPDGSTEVKIRFACSLTLAGKSAGHIVGEIKLTWNPEPLPDKLSAAIKDLSSLVQDVNGWETEAEPESGSGEELRFDLEEWCKSADEKEAEVIDVDKNAESEI